MYECVKVGGVSILCFLPLATPLDTHPPTYPIHKQAVFVASVPGKYEGHEKYSYGYLRLQRLLEKESLPADTFCLPSSSSSCSSSSPVVRAAGVVCQFSSMGSHAGDGKWVKEHFEPALRSSATHHGTRPQARALATHIVWPRMVDVEHSVEGWNAGGALPCQPKNMFTNSPLYDDPARNTIHPYLRQRICRWGAARWGRERAMPHFKSFLRYAVVDEAVPAAAATGGGGGGSSSSAMVQRQTITRLGWVLITSHNYSKPAWGELQAQGRVLKIQSFEVGVLFLPSRYQRLERTFSLTPDHPLLGLGGPAQEGITGFYSASCQEAKTPRPGLLAMPIPYECPPPAFEEGDVPWVTPEKKEW